jgi:hypothetical protein
LSESNDAAWGAGCHHRIVAGWSGEFDVIDKGGTMGSFVVTATEEGDAEGTADQTTDDHAHPLQVTNPRQEQADHDVPAERSPFVTIGGGLVALGLLACSTGRTRHQPARRRARSHGYGRARIV